MARPIDADALSKTLNDFWLSTLPRERDDKETALERAAMCRGIDDCIKYVHDSPTIGGWISVKDRMPKTEQKVLVSIKTACGTRFTTVAAHVGHHERNSESDVGCHSQNRRRRLK